MVCHKLIRWKAKGVLFIFFLFFWQVSLGQTKKDKDEILYRRNLSNLAIKEHRVVDIANFQTEDLVIVSGNGTLISGKASLTDYLTKVFSENPNLFFLRKPKKVLIDENGKMAWEEGSWKSQRLDDAKWTGAKGRYSAMWIKTDGKWKIRSQLFVAL